MTKNPVNWFELPVSDMDRAIQFYQNILGIELSLQEMGNLIMAWFPMVQGGDGSTGTLVQNPNYTPSYEGTLIYFSVDDIETVLGRVEANGGKVLNPKSSIGKFGFVAHFEDSEGNRVALHADK